MRPDPAPLRSDQAGFTLAEVLIAIVVLVFGLVGITNLFLLAGSSTSVANLSSATTTAAVETMETLKGKSFSTLSTGGSVDGVSDSCVDGTFSRCDGDETVAADVKYKGVGRISTKWEITEAQGDPAVLFIRVRSEAMGPLGGVRTRIELTTFRVCSSAQADGCPVGAVGVP